MKLSQDPGRSKIRGGGVFNLFEWNSLPAFVRFELEVDRLLGGGRVAPRPASPPCRHSAHPEAPAAASPWISPDPSGGASPASSVSTAPRTRRPTARRRADSPPPLPFLPPPRCFIVLRRHCHVWSSGFVPVIGRVFPAKNQQNPGFLRPISELYDTSHCIPTSPLRQRHFVRSATQQ